MGPLRFLVISPTDLQQGYFQMVLRVAYGPIEYAAAATLEEGCPKISAWQPDVVLIAVDLLALGETGFLEQFQAAPLVDRSLVVADVNAWLNWRWGPQKERVLLKGFSIGELRRKVRHLMGTEDSSY